MDITTSYVILSWFYIAFTLCLVLNRLYQRALYRADLSSVNLANAGDCLVVLAWLFNVAQCSCDLVIYVNKGFVGGAGAKAEIVSAKKLNRIRRVLWAKVNITAVGITFIKILYIATCLPVPTGQYFFEAANRYTTSSIITSTGITLHMATDLYIYIIPFFFFRHLKLVKTSKRLAAGVMFGAGFILVCLGLPILIDSIPLGIVPHDKYTMWSFFWPLHEQNFAVFVACLPALHKTIQRWRSSRGSKGKSVLDRVMRGELTTQEVVQSKRGDQDRFEAVEKMESGRPPVYGKGVMTQVSEMDLA